MSQTGQLKQQKFIASQFWKPQVQDRCDFDGMGAGLSSWLLDDDLHLAVKREGKRGAGKERGEKREEVVRGERRGGPGRGRQIPQSEAMLYHHDEQELTKSTDKVQAET
jgi:hypothetical protein